MQTNLPRTPTPPTLTDPGAGAREPTPQPAVLPVKRQTSSATEGMRSSANPGTGLPVTFWLALMLDEVSHGMVLVDAQARVLHANHAARAECNAGHPLQLRQGELRVRQTGHQGLLQDALASARRGRRTLLSLDGAERSVSLAVVPLDSVDGQATLLILGRRQACEPLSVQGFAGCHALTPAETRVLAGLCEGRHAREVAQRHGVSLATVRSQIRSMRTKTGAKSIDALVRQVSVLPPMRGSLRTVA